MQEMDGYRSVKVIKLYMERQEVFDISLSPFGLPRVAVFACQLFFVF